MVVMIPDRSATYAEKHHRKVQVRVRQQDRLKTGNSAVTVELVPICI